MMINDDKSCIENAGFCIENDEFRKGAAAWVRGFVLKTDEFCTQNDGMLFKMMDFASK